MADTTTINDLTEKQTLVDTDKILVEDTNGVGQALLGSAISDKINGALTNYDSEVDLKIKDLIKTTTITINAQEIRTKTNWITKTIKLPTATNKIINAQIMGYASTPAILTYWGFEVRVSSIDGNTILIGVKKTVADDWNQNINILITYY